MKKGIISARNKQEENPQEKINEYENYLKSLPRDIDMGYEKHFENVTKFRKIRLGYYLPEVPNYLEIEK